MIIYKITNTKNNKIYIGQTINGLNKRWKEHIYLSKYSEIKTNLYSAILKYGVENFKIEEIDGANSQTELNYKEWLWIHKSDCLAPNGYNMKEGGGSSGKYTQDIKIKISKANKKRVWSKEAKENMSEAIRKWHVSNPQSRNSKSRAKIAEANKERWKKDPDCRKKAMDKFLEYNKKISKPVTCVETGITYDSIKSAARALNINDSLISQAVRGIRKKAKGLTFILKV